MADKDEMINENINIHQLKENSRNDGTICRVSAMNTIEEIEITKAPKEERDFPIIGCTNPNLKTIPTSKFVSGEIKDSIVIKETGFCVRLQTACGNFVDHPVI
jgi:hypothetical protein